MNYLNLSVTKTHPVGSELSGYHGVFTAQGPLVLEVLFSLVEPGQAVCQQRQEVSLL